MSYIAICFCNIVAFRYFAYNLSKGITSAIFFSNLNLLKKSYLQKIQYLSAFQHLCNIVAKKTLKKNEKKFAKSLEL